MDTLCVDPRTDPRWLALLDAPGASVFHSPPWLSTLAEGYGFQPEAVIGLDPDGTPVAGIPFCRISDLLGTRIASLPFSDYCDPLVASRKAWQDLFARLQTDASPLNLRCLDGSIAAADERLAVVKRARWHGLSLASPLEMLWSGLDGSTRRAIRKAEREGVVVEPLDGSRGLEEFLRMHQALRKRKYRLLAQPHSFFEALRRRFVEAGGWVPLGASHRGRLVAATIYLRWGDTLYYKFNASQPDGLDVRPNSLLLWEGVKLGKSIGCQSLDLGASDDDQPGLIRFKRNFGAAERELRFLRYTPPGWKAEEAAPARKLLGELTSLLTEASVPDDVTNRAAEVLYRFFA